MSAHNETHVTLSTEGREAAETQQRFPWIRFPRQIPNKVTGIKFREYSSIGKRADILRPDGRNEDNRRF
jgi:hypothetical protein